MELIQNSLSLVNNKGILALTCNEFSKLSMVRIDKLYSMFGATVDNQKSNSDEVS